MTEQPDTDWLDDQEFYEACQAYRWAGHNGNERDVVMRFEELKSFIRAKISQSALI